MDYELEYDEEEEAQQQAAIREYREERAALITRLENKFLEDGLRFTVPFTGSIPNIALGEYKSMRFDFRFRGDYARLSVGNFNVQKAEDEYRKELSDWDTSKSWADEDEKQDFKPRPPLTSGTHIRPNEVLFFSDKENVTGEPYSSDLTSEEAEELFTDLLKNLEPAS